MERFRRRHLSAWMVRGCRAVDWSDGGVASSGAVVKARRTRMVVWNCMVELEYWSFLIWMDSDGLVLIGKKRIRLLWLAEKTILLL